MQIILNISNKAVYSISLLIILLVIVLSAYSLSTSISTDQGYHESTQVNVKIGGVDYTLQEAIDQELLVGTINVTGGQSATTVNTNIVQNLVPGQQYVVHVYGITEDRGRVWVNLNPVKIETCDGSNVLASSGDPFVINWHDGNAPQSATLVITAPADGCIKGFTDIGDALMMTVVSII